MKIGDTLQLLVSDVSRGGAGVARDPSGLTVFIPYTVTGDTVRARITEHKRKFAHAQLLEVLEPGPHRQGAKCPVFGQCGGCQWQHIPYAMQWQIKLAGVQQVLHSSGIRSSAIAEFPAKQTWHYRNRVQLRGHEATLGYYASRSHDIVDIQECFIAHERINAELSATKAQGKRLGKAYKVELETLENGEVRSVWNQEHAAAGFRQINDEQNQNLKHWIQQALNTPQPLLDLYGGNGNLSHELSQDREVFCVDVSAPATAPEHSNANIQFYRADVLPWLKQRITEIKFKRQANFVSASAIIDPPRGGLGDSFNDIAERLEFLQVHEIIAVGCKTEPWARDIGAFINRGWSLRQIAALDFFPHTAHVETVAHLRKPS